ncbi:MAG: magnesium/cobalt transporter CorA [Candidatus Sumerlaeia bacterium]|nr:magnesium/cobalt transporter CorA [Candidatus Sumerlaeia bacterium]
MKRRHRHTKTNVMKLGMPPGTPMYVGEASASPTSLTVVEYDANLYEVVQCRTLEEVDSYRKSPTTTWLNIDGLEDVPLLERLAKRFQLHPLLLEDVLNTRQRPKFEDYPEHLFFVFRMYSFEPDGETLKSEQLSLVLGKDYLLSFQEEKGDIYDMLRERMRLGKGRVRTSGPDYLFYAMLDVAMDYYLLIVEHFEAHLDHIEEELLTNPTERTLQKMYEHRRDAVELRRSLLPLREALSQFARCESPLLQPETRLYIRDACDHAQRALDALDHYRESIATLTEIYLSTMSERMNQVIKRLTLVATIFIPLTFVVGVYGMNFDYMPELRWKYGYLAVWIAMITLVTAMLLYFKKRRWI